MSILGKPKKLAAERHRRIVQVLFNDEDYLRLLKHSTGYSLSEWCRNKLTSLMDDIENSEQAGDHF